MEGFTQRVSNEKVLLDKNIVKLISFIDGEVFATLRETDQSLLVQQCSVMQEYSNILNERINYIQGE